MKNQRNLYPTLILFLFVVSFVFVASCTNKLKIVDDSSAKSDIRKVLLMQQEAWSRGDIDAFMTGYWNSDQLSFTGSRGLTKGWQQTLENYKKGYPDKTAMGILEFTVIELMPLSENAYTMIGKYELTRTEDKPSGYFTLIWKKINNQWLIVSDHTSASPTE